MSHDKHNMTDALLREYVLANSNWPETDEEIEAMLNDESESDPYSELERAARVRAVLEACGENPIGGVGEQGVLFDLQAATMGAATKPRISELFHIVSLAYREVHEGWSSDRLIADPDMDARFIHSCWKGGAQAPQSLLNHLLMNARKRKMLGKTESAKHYHVKPGIMDQYLFASEFAARLIQEREYATNQRKVTEDNILCDPALAREFDDIAKTVSPGFAPLDYRWALFALRKGKSRRQQEIAELPFDWLGQLDSIRVGQLNPVGGFLWIRAGQVPVYIGHTENLRKSIDRIAQVRIERILEDLPLFRSQKKEPLELGISERPRSSVTSREPFKNVLVSQCSPHLNLRNWQRNNPRKDDTNGEKQSSRGAA